MPKSKPNFTNLRPKSQNSGTISRPNLNIAVNRGRINVPTPIFQGIKTDADVVFEGGATLGAAYVGSLTLMEEAGINFKRIAGNSAGAITAGLVAAGYTANEIEWLMSNFQNTRLPKPSTLSNSAVPIDFMDFLDFPDASSLNTASKRETLLWKLLKGEIIDQILSIEVPIPTKSSIVNSSIAGIKKNPILKPLMTIPGVEGALKSVLATTLFFWPTTKPTLNSFNPFKTASLRISFADKAWDAIAKKNPMIYVEAQLLYEGSLFEGNSFLNTMDNLLRERIPGSGKVQFKDLPIPLAVIAFNYANGKIIVYSSKTHPTMNVAEAVRRSMSLPVVFQPRKVNVNNRGSSTSETIIDGGVGSNFPIWLFNDSGDIYWPTSTIDPNRIKIGLTLNETIDTPSGWNVNPPKFNLNGNGEVDTMEVVVPILIEKLKELNILVPGSTTSESEMNIQLKNLKLLEVLIGFTSADKEEAARDQLITSIMNGKKYFDIVIPLLGFHGFDFSINGDRNDLEAIAERGYFAALDALSIPPRTGTGGAVILNKSGFNNPFS